MTWIEYVAVAFGLVAVYLTTRQNLWCWPTGLVQVSLYVVVFWNARLYSDMFLHVIYIFVQFYGWYHWKTGGAGRSELQVTRLDVAGWAIWLSVAIGSGLALGHTMATYTDADFAYLDAFITSFSLVAQWLMARKILENWHLWIGVDVVAIGVYAAKGLYPTTALYAVFLLLCLLGLREWTRSMAAPTPAAAETRIH